MSITQENEVLKLARSVVQYYREYEKLIASLYNSVNALANMTHQKEILESSIRRNRSFASDAHMQQQQQEEQQQQYNTHDDDYNYISSNHGKSTSWSSLCATGSLGMLLAFPESIAEHLVGQHQLDQSRLFQSMSELVQKTTAKSKELQIAITSWEESHLNAAMCHNNNLVYDSSGSTTTVNKTKHNTHKSKNYSVHEEGHREEEEEEKMDVVKVNYHDKLFEVTVLENEQALIHASYGVMRAMIKMNSLVQETVLALRKDLFRRFIMTRSGNKSNNNNMKHFASSVKEITDNDSIINSCSNTKNKKNDNDCVISEREEQETSEHHGIYEKISDNSGNSRKAHCLSELFALERSQREQTLHKPLQTNSVDKLIHTNDDIQDDMMSFNAKHLNHANEVYFLSDALDMLPDFLQTHWARYRS